MELPAHGSLGKEVDVLPGFLACCPSPPAVHPNPLHINVQTTSFATIMQAILGRIARVDYAIPPEMEKSPELRDLIWWAALAFGSRIFGWFLARAFVLQLAFL